MSSTLEKLVRHHHGAVFDRSPVAVRAMRINADAWEVTGINLVAERGSLTHTYPLAAHTLASLGAALVADGYSVQELNSEVASLSAMTLLASGGQQDGALNNQLQAYTSLLWVLMHCYAVEVDAAREAVLQALRQMVISTASGEWLDLWGTLYSVPRASGELDADYADRIPVEAFRARCNSFAIEAAIRDATGFDVRITEPWRRIARLDNFRLSGSQRLYSGDSIGYHLIKPVTFDAIDWPAVLSVINRNRAAGTVVLRPDLYMTAVLDVGAALDVEHASAVGVSVADTLLLDPPQSWRPEDWSEGTWMDGDFAWGGDVVIGGV